ncbi:hypothetical protein DO97_17345 [Neosynechococcus sphagnicola sy1]|uniref:DUF1818 domain-containing protein n=1 Tax=Neosynechococcus sphagnicola sy1 TaxID=1497020 RepID=A0A098THP3_9CYAN|nr:DUF1818 family protein [Neosynechococcus sphagnicola]KGF71604.1 hypothetical protein DO97_17345 [Neosynechococcus sphagnicola sy1]
MARLVKTGSGWRVGWDESAAEFHGLVGGEEWAIELTTAELDDFCRLSAQLANTTSQMTQELMDEETLHCEVETDLLYLEISGYPHAYDLRLILQTGRRCEVFWPASVARELMLAVQTLKVY